MQEVFLQSGNEEILGKRVLRDMKKFDPITAESFDMNPDIRKKELQLR